MSRQDEVLSWAIAMFGPVAGKVDERATRFAEEAIEVAHAGGVPIDLIIKIANRIYGKPAGEMRKEIGGAAVTLDALCAVVGTNPIWEAEEEFNRIKSLPKEHWSSRHAAKVANGTADAPT